MQRRIATLIAIGGAIGVLLSLVAHGVPAVLLASGPAGALISLIFGVVFGRGEAGPAGRAALGGALTGAGCAFIGILAAFLMGDQPVMVLAGGTVGGAVAGALGAVLGRPLLRPKTGGTPS